MWWLTIGADISIIRLGIGIITIYLTTMIVDAMVVHHVPREAALEGPIDKVVRRANEAVMVVDGIVMIA